MLVAANWNFPIKTLSVTKMQFSFRNKIIALLHKVFPVTLLGSDGLRLIEAPDAEIIDSLYKLLPYQFSTFWTLWPLIFFFFTKQFFFVEIKIFRKLESQVTFQMIWWKLKLFKYNYRFLIDEIGSAFG